MLAGEERRECAGIDQQLYAACDAWLAPDKSLTLESDEHLVHGRRCAAKVAPQIGFGGRPTEHQRIGVDECQILSLLLCEARFRRGVTRLGTAIHVSGPQTVGADYEGTGSRGAEPSGT